MRALVFATLIRPFFSLRTEHFTVAHKGQHFQK